VSSRAARRDRAAAQGRAEGHARAGRHGDRPQRRLRHSAVGRRRRRLVRPRGRRRRDPGGAAAGGPGLGRGGGDRLPAGRGGPGGRRGCGHPAGAAGRGHHRRGTGEPRDRRPGPPSRRGRAAGGGPARAHLCRCRRRLVRDGGPAERGFRLGVGVRGAGAVVDGVPRRGRGDPGRRRRSGVPALPHRRARRGGGPGRPRRLDRPVRGDHPRGPRPGRAGGGSLRCPGRRRPARRAGRRAGTAHRRRRTLRGRGPDAGRRAGPAGRGVGLDVEPRRGTGRLVEPRALPGLPDAVARWSGS
jgi:hypothetical protein